ncbi:DUF3306 domain-containing protein [Nisaea acidiphila]|uniref:DUF3306 domain-containing protein n=1 Tax=Nisaea acidiphila TaxID=1862145 RepID=A0A9J7B0M7_9PROT|nr:DUF3306 domain-containing protein [Nisaea acidiphila]UUX52028.1 DUF3306 domain-containing protein [Nisaea acidiphila]
MSERDDIPGRGFLGRWSERKQASREPVEASAALSIPEPAPETALPELYVGDERPLTEEEEAVVAALPDIESLDAESDFTPFMQTNVPEFLRRRALRALWRLNPVLANVDGLIDYGEDYTDAATVIEGLQTAYKVGRGFLTDEDLGIEPEAGDDAQNGETSGDGVAAAEPDATETDSAAGDTEEDEEVGDGDLV